MRPAIPAPLVRAHCALSETDQATPFLADRFLSAVSVPSAAHRVPRIVGSFRKRDSPSLSGRTLLSARPAGRIIECAGQPCALSRPAVEPGNPDSHDVSWTLLLRVGLPSRICSPLFQ